MTLRRGRFLFAVEAVELFRRFESYISRDLRVGEDLRAEHCPPDQIDPILRDYAADAVIVIQPRFQEDLPAAVRRWKTLRPSLQALFLFRRLPNTRAVVDLMRAGAFDVLDTEIEAIGEPLIHEVLSGLLRRLDEVRAGSFEQLHARSSLSDIGLIGESVETQNLFVQILHAARLSCPVLISGEPGSGKRLAAHAIHALSPRADRQIVTVDCLSLSPPLLSAALFGKAVPDTAGRGTILLNEISEIPPAVQMRLQKMLESANGDGSSAADRRIISTATRRMDQLVEARSFRADLYNRLNVLPIEIPPLRRRLQDVPLLAQYFLSRLERDGRALTVSAEAAQALRQLSLAWQRSRAEKCRARNLRAGRPLSGRRTPPRASAGIHHLRRPWNGAAGALRF